MTTQNTPWHKSSYSGSAAGCVEVAEGRTVLVRDTENRQLGSIGYSPRAWSVFLRDVKNGLI